MECLELKIGEPTGPLARARLKREQGSYRYEVQLHATSPHPLLYELHGLVIGTESQNTHCTEYLVQIPILASCDGICGMQQ
jgi:hypothetical protein